MLSYRAHWARDRRGHGSRQQYCGNIADITHRDNGGTCTRGRSGCASGRADFERARQSDWGNRANGQPL